MRYVACLVGGTSEKFVPQPSKDDVLIDAMTALRGFKDSVRWREFHRLEKKERKKELNKMMGRDGGVTDEEISLESVVSESTDDEGYKTGLRPMKTRMTAPTGSDNLEAFLKQVEMRFWTLHGSMNRAS